MITAAELRARVEASGPASVHDSVAVAQLALVACRTDHGDALTAAIGAVLLLAADSADAIELLDVAIRALELGRTSINRIKAQDAATAAEIAARRARDAS